MMLGIPSLCTGLLALVNSLIMGHIEICLFKCYLDKGKITFSRFTLFNSFLFLL